jgi:putative flippase GtrA
VAPIANGAARMNDLARLRPDRPPTAENHPATALLRRLLPVAPVRLLLFATIGGIGVSTHLVVLRLALGVFGIAFPVGQAMAAAVATTGNFLLNNILTYRDRRLRGSALARGLFSFYAVCGIGVAANVTLAAHLYAGACPWWLAAIGGAAVSALWNYAISSAVVWRSPRAAASGPPPVRGRGDKTAAPGGAAD